MAENLVETYQQALKQMLAAKERIEHISRTVGSAGNALKDWKRVHVKNADATFPSALVTDPTCPFINANEWPTAQEIADALLEWRTALDAAKEVWAKLPEDSRVGFGEPTAY